MKWLLSGAHGAAALVQFPLDEGAHLGRVRGHRQNQWFYFRFLKN